MAIAAIIEFPEGTLAKYDEVIRKVNSTPEGSAAAGRLFHWVARTGGDIRVTDVWESRGQFEAYYRDYATPAASEAGLYLGDVTIVEVHNYLAAGPSS
jgi:hypothetical protein